MTGREESAAGARAVSYCLLPRALAPKLGDLLRRHFHDDPDVEVVIDARAGERRRSGDRRCGAVERPGAMGGERPASPPVPERRRIRNAAGRRVGDRRATIVNVPAPALPRRARPHAAQLTFFERLEPSAEHAEDLDTARIVTRIQAGDTDAFALLYTRYFDRVYSYMRLLFKDPDDADDGTQQVFLKVLEGLPRYEERSARFRGWLFVIARNHAFKQLQRRHRIETVELDDRDGPELGVAPCETDLQPLHWISDRELHVLIQRLPVAQRQVLFLRHVAGLRDSEIAAVLGQSPVGVRQHHARAIRFLRERLTALGREPRRHNHVGAHRLVRRMRVLRARRFSLAARNAAG